MADDPNLVVVYSGTAAEGHLVRSLLERHGIRHVMRDQSVPVDNIAELYTPAAIATIEVLVDPDDYERAREVLSGR
jgi:hypothetical protein